MQTVNKIFAAMLAVVFIVTAVAALFLFNLERRVFSPATYQEVLANEGFYDRLPGVMAEALIGATTGQSGLPVMLRGLPQQDVETFLRVIMPPDVLKAVGDQTLASVFAYVDQKAENAQVSLAPLKANIATDASVQAVYGLLSNQPPCTVDQLLNMSVLLLQQQLTFCNPPPDVQPLLTPVIQIQLQAISANLPDSVTLMSANHPAGTADPRERLRLARSVMKFSPLIAFAFWFSYFLLVLLSFPNWLDWLGLPMMISGGFAFLAALIGSPVIQILIQNVLAINMPRYVPAILLDYTGDFAGAVTRQFLQPVVWEGLLLAVVGLGILALSFILKQKGRTL